MSGAVRYHRDGDCGHVIIANALRRNAVSQAMWQGLAHAVEAAEADPRVKVIIISGEGEHFAAGADISEFETIYATPETARASSAIITAGLDAVEQARKPVIAAIEGSCVGGGVSIASGADIRIAGHSGRFGVTPGKLGLCYPVGDTRRLVALVGKSAAKELLFTGRIINAETAKELGLIDHIVDDKTALSRATAMADEIASASQWSARASKTIINAVSQGARDDDASLARLYLEAFSGEDFQEGFRAFLDKRKPDFRFR